MVEHGSREWSGPHPYVAADVAALTVADGTIHALLIPPEDRSDGSWRIPGAYVQPGESLDQTVSRILVERAGLPDGFVQQMYTFGDDPVRDERLQTITVVHFALYPESVLRSAVEAAARDERLLGTVLVPWKGAEGDPWTVIVTDQDGHQLNLAYDHRRLLGSTINFLRIRLEYSPIGYELLPRAFTLRELRQVHEALSGRPIDPDVFRRRMRASGEIATTGELEGEAGLGHRPAELFEHKGPRSTAPVGCPAMHDDRVAQLPNGRSKGEPSHSV